MSDTRAPFLPCSPAMPFAGLLWLVTVAASAQTSSIWTPSVAPAGVQSVAGIPTAAGGPQPSFWSASVLLRETATDNVNLTPSSTADFAMVTEITPSLTLRHTGSSTNLYGFVSLPVVLYLPSGVASDRVYPTVNLLGDVALVKNFLFVEGAVNVTQEFFNPFGAQPASLVNPTQNRYRTDLYRISPFIRGTTQANTSYELRNDNIWTNLSGAPINTTNSYYSTWSGFASNTQTTLGWQASFNYTDIKFTNQNPITTQIYRLTPLYNVTPSLRLSASGGYEANDFALTSSSGAIYGVGFVWHPTPRTNVAGDWEHRFFGSSYQFALDHATPLSVWRVSLSRNITSYPQQIASVPTGVSVAAFLNNLFAFRIPDPAERQQLVDDFIQERGLPSTLSAPVNLYTEQILLQQSATARVGLIGARNTVYLTLYNVKNEPITASGVVLPPLFATGNNNTQTGGSAVWTHELTPSLSLVASIDGLRTVGNAPSTANTKQGAIRLALTTRLSPATGLFAGARYQTLQSNAQSDYDETAAFVGLFHRFR